MSERTAFKVVYSYYRYNDGRANNGDFCKEHTCKSGEEAVRLAERINAIATRYKAVCDGDDTVSEDQQNDDRELMDDLIDGACGGYFHPGAVAYVDHIRREPLVSTSVAAKTA